MFLKIISPENILFSKEIISVTLPGTEGFFQILENHTAVISNLEKGVIKIIGTDLQVLEKFKNKFQKKQNELLLTIENGTVEIKNNKVIILID